MRSNLDDNKCYNLDLRSGLKMGTTNQVLTGPITIGANAGPILSLDANGATRVVTMPLKGSRFMYLVVNKAAGAFALTINDSTGATVGSVPQNKSAWVVDDGLVTSVLAGA